MVHSRKRLQYVAEEVTTDSDMENAENSNDMDFTTSLRKTTNRRSSKHNMGLSRNALMARENRLRKKIYVTNLENTAQKLQEENSRFVKLVNSQKQAILDLQHEVKYLKSVLANSPDIGYLLKTLHRTTGMSVTTSLDANVNTPMLGKSYVPKTDSMSSKCLSELWDEDIKPNIVNDTKPLPILYNSLNEHDTPLDISDDFNRTFGFHVIDIDDSVKNGELFDEHNYTTNAEDDIGVCLHLSKQQLSLEFCSKCSENAAGRSSIMKHN